MGPQSEDYIETVLTCEGDFYDPKFHAQLQHFSQKLEELILQDRKRKKLILKKVEPWNSVRVTFNIPKEAALRLKCLAEQGDATLKELGILAVEIEGDRKISLKIAGKNNETTEFIFQTAATNPRGTTGTQNFEVNISDDMNIPGPSNVTAESTRKNIQDYLQQGTVFGPGAATPSHQVTNTGIVSFANTNVPHGQGLGVFSDMSPKFPTPPPSVSTPNSPNAKLGTVSGAVGNLSHPLNPAAAVQTMVKQLLGNKSASPSPLLVNLLQNDIAAGNVQLNSVALSQALSSALPQAVNSMFQQNMNRTSLPIENIASEPPPKKKRRTRKPKDKDGNVRKDKSMRQQSESVIIQNILNQAVGGTGMQPDLRVPPLGMSDVTMPIMGSGVRSKGSTPSSSRAATPAKSSCPGTPKSPIYGQSLAPGQRHIINPQTGQLEVVDEDLSFTPPKRDYPPKDIHENAPQYTVPKNPSVALPLQNVPMLPTIDHGTTAMKSQYSTMFPVSSISEGNMYISTMSDVQSRSVYATSIATVPDANYNQILTTPSYSRVPQSSQVLTCSQNNLVQQSDLSQSVSVEFSNSPIVSMPQTVSAILSNVSESGNFALATLNLPAASGGLTSTGSTMQTKSVPCVQPAACSQSSGFAPSTSAVLETNLHETVSPLSSLQTLPTADSLGSKSTLTSSVLLTNPVVSSTNSSTSCEPVTQNSVVITSSAITEADVPCIPNSQLQITATTFTSQITQNADSASQVKGAIVNALNVGPANNNSETEPSETCQHNAASATPTTQAHGVHMSATEHQGSSLSVPSSPVESTSSLLPSVSANVNGSNGDPIVTQSGIYNNLTQAQPPDSEHSNQSAEDQGKRGSGSVDSGLGDIKENNGESPCGSSGNDSPGVTVSSSGNRDSDNEKEKEFSQSDKNVITVGYVLSKSETPPVEKSLCDKLIKCNHNDMNSVMVHKPQHQNSSTSSQGDDLQCDTSINVPSLVKLHPTEGIEQDTLKCDKNQTDSLNWMGRSDLNPGGLQVEKVCDTIQFPSSKTTAESVEDRASLVQVCSNDAKVLEKTLGNTTKPEEKSELETIVETSPSPDATPTNSIINSQPEGPCDEICSSPVNVSKSSDASYTSNVTSMKSKTVIPNEKEDDASGNHDSEQVLLNQENMIVDHVQNIDSYSDIKVTNDNTVIINTNDLDESPVCEATKTTESSKEEKIPLSLWAAPNSSDTVVSVSQQETEFLQEPEEEKETHPVAVIMKEPGIDGTDVCVSSSSTLLESETVIKSNGPVPLGSTYIDSVQTVELVSVPAGPNLNFEPCKVSVDSNLNLELPPQSYSLSSIQNHSACKTKVALNAQVSCSKPLENTLSTVTSVSTISTVAPSIRSVSPVPRDTCVITTAVSSGLQGMASLGPSPIMSTGVTYFQVGTVLQEDAIASISELTGTDKHLKGHLQKGISIMKPLRDRESSIDEDLLESPVKDKKVLPTKKITEKFEKPVTSGLQKRSNYTVAQLLDEADKVKQNQGYFRPYMGSDKNENLFTSSSITTASAALKQMAKSIDERNDKADAVNKTVPNLIKTVNDSNYSSDIVCNSISDVSSCEVESTVEVPTLEETSTGLVNQEHATVSTLPKSHLNTTESPHAAVPTTTTLVSSNSRPVSSNLVSISPQEAVLPNSTSTSPSCNVNIKESLSKITITKSPPKIMSSNSSVTKGKTVNKNNVSNPIEGIKGRFIKIEPEKTVPTVVRNVIVKSSPSKLLTNVKADVRSISASNLILKSVPNAVDSSKHAQLITVPSKAGKVPSAGVLNLQLNSNLVHEHSYSARPNDLPDVVSSSTSSEVASIALSESDSVVQSTIVNHIEPSMTESSSISFKSDTIVPTCNDTDMLTAVEETVSCSTSKSISKTLHKETSKTLTITGGKSSESSKELTKVTLDLRSAVTHPGSSSKFIKLEPGKGWETSSVNKVTSNITVRVNSEATKAHVAGDSDTSQTISAEHGYSKSDQDLISNSVALQIKAENQEKTPPNGKPHSKPDIKSTTCKSDEQDVNTSNPEKILSNKRKNLDSDITNESEEKETSPPPPLKSLRTARRKSSDIVAQESDVIKLPARITRRSSRGSNDSKASSTDGSSHVDELHNTKVKRSSKPKTVSESMEKLEKESEQVGKISGIVEHRTSPVPPAVKNLKSTRRRASDKEKTPDNLDDPGVSNMVNDNHGRATRSSKRKVINAEEKELTFEKKMKPDESILPDTVSSSKLKQECEAEEPADTAKKIPTRNRTSKVKNSEQTKIATEPPQNDDSEKTSESKENNSCKRSTRSTRSVEHCELPNNYVTKKKSKPH